VCSSDLEDLREWCHSGIAQAKQDVSICKKLKNGSVGYNCYYEVAAAKGDLSICDMLMNRTKDVCYYYVAKETGNATICEKIGEDTKFEINPHIDPSGGPNIRDSCYREIYMEIATAQKNLSICDLIRDRYSVGICYRAICYSTKNQSLINQCQDNVEKFNLSSTGYG